MIVAVAALGIGYLSVASWYGDPKPAPAPAPAEISRPPAVDGRSSAAELAVPLSPAREEVPAPPVNVPRLMEDAVREANAVSGEILHRPSQVVVKEEFGYWCVLAREAGVTDVPADFILPAQLIDAFAATQQKWESAYKAIELVRIPLLDSVAAQKKERGQYEEYLNPGSVADGDKSKRLGRAWREARKPTEPGQSVVVSGDARAMRIIRVNGSDHPDLARINATLEEAKRAYVNDFYFLVAPYLR